LADAAREAAAALRTSCRVAATARAARAGVAMTAPLAVCFLPAFLSLGLAPTVIGMVATIHLW
jgi:pilus assembly protein TadC